MEQKRWEQEAECPRCQKVKPYSRFHPIGSDIWPECIDCLASTTPDLPAACPLPLTYKQVLWKTQLAGEYPCLGCFRGENCSERIGEKELRVAELMMGEAISGIYRRKCARCKNVLTKWVIERGLRVWACQQPECGWTLSEGVSFFY